MKNVDSALQKFKAGHACSQAVFATYAVQMGISEETALKISCSFGGGMGRMGETCGAVTGAFMVIGLKHGRVNPLDSESREKTDKLVRKFSAEFINRNHSFNCRELIGYDLTDPRQLEKANADGIFDRVCDKLVSDSAEILDNIL